MCHWGDTVQVVLPEGHPTERERVRLIDRCLAPVVSALNAAGVWTTASCCGHGKRPGTIALVDGRECTILPDFESGRRVDALFPLTIQGTPSDRWTKALEEAAKAAHAASSPGVPWETLRPESRAAWRKELEPGLRAGLPILLVKHP